MRVDSVRKMNEVLGKEFETEEQAFLTYKEKKETYIKIVAKEWKGKIEDRAYEALKSWQIN